MRFASVAVVAVLFASSVAAGPPDRLDRRVFDVTVAYTNGNVKAHAKLSFGGGELVTNIDFDGAKVFAYKTTSKDGIVSFTASATSGSGEAQKLVEWNGKLEGPTITGTLVVVQKGLGSHLVFSGDEKAAR